MGGPALGVGIVVLIGAVILGAIVISLVAWIVRWRDRVRSACCGACRYPVEGLTTFTCPECGADFRTAGILVPGVRPKHRIHVAEIFAAWAAVAVLGGVITAGVVGNTTFGRRMIFSRNEVLTPVSSGMGKVNIAANGTAPAQRSVVGAPANSLVVQMAQTTSPTPMLLAIDVRARTWEVRPSAGPAQSTKTTRGTIPIKEAEVIAWLNATGATQPGGAPSKEVAALTAYLNNSEKPVDGSVFQAGAAVINFTLAPASWVFAGSAALWFVIFVIGSALIAKAHTTRRRKVVAPPSVAAA